MLVTSAGLVVNRAPGVIFTGKGVTRVTPAVDWDGISADGAGSGEMHRKPTVWEGLRLIRFGLGEGMGDVVLVLLVVVTDRELRPPGDKNPEL